MTRDEAKAHAAAFFARFDAHRNHAVGEILRMCGAKGGLFVTKQTLAAIVAQGYNAGVLALSHDAMRLDYLQEREKSGAIEQAAIREQFLRNLRAGDTEGAAEEDYPWPYLVLSADRSACWGETYREAIDAAMEDDRTKADAAGGAQG